MRCLLVGLVAIAIVSPAFAKDIVITVNNQSTQMVEGFDAYPVATDGTIIEDQIGGFSDAVAPGGVGIAELATTRCGSTYVRVYMSDSDQLSSIIDTCTQTTLVVTD